VVASVDERIDRTTARPGNPQGRFSAVVSFTLLILTRGLLPFNGQVVLGDGSTVLALTTRRAWGDFLWRLQVLWGSALTRVRENARAATEGLEDPTFEV